MNINEEETQEDKETHMHELPGPPYINIWHRDVTK
jgi:hypothetical protein